MPHLISGLWHSMCYPQSVWMLLFDYLLVNAILMGGHCLWDILVGYGVEDESWKPRIAQYLTGVAFTFLFAGGVYALLALDEHEPQTQNVFIVFGYMLLMFAAFAVSFLSLLGQAAGLWGSWICAEDELIF